MDYLRSGIQLDDAIVKLGSLLCSIELNCMICRERKLKTVTPLKSEQPVERLKYRQVPFNNCGVDCFGPFYVTIRQISEKLLAFPPPLFDHKSHPHRSYSINGC